ncbi:hypothetical protein BOW53_16250 [Solemya pervernicosa gill symbiont]|uniref:Tyrosyl-tRNA deacylase n=1 Tax=Solemya pervernicosa gill symbiont TaxID=642797 RepID=A0A1T2KZR6_9GAMM|nr:hypothetical protein [Solemya pervernicosa gill symbiont]OOZ38216.1 hypothetical protein BOW53_16250 [Solemya pervernicosa gill symbiont]
MQNSVMEINNHINETVKSILKGAFDELPEAGHPLVDDYVRRIQGTYDVSKSKSDTDNAIDLLYIAYNTTPQDEGDIRVSIDNLMSLLVDAQQKSELKMKKAYQSASYNTRLLGDLFFEWCEVRKAIDNPELVKSFISEELYELANKIKKSAGIVVGDLENIVTTYDNIIIETTKTTSHSQESLANRLHNKEEINKEITKDNGDREKIESMVESLSADIQKYEKEANDIRSRAEKAEDRAFFTSLVKGFTDVITGVLPAITGGLTGGGNSNTPRQLAHHEDDDSSGGSDADVIKTKKDIADKSSELAASQREKDELEEKGKKLAVDREEIIKDEGSSDEAKSSKLEAIDKRINANTSDLKNVDEKLSVAKVALDSLKGALKSLSESMGKQSSQQQGVAQNLRDQQMKMLEKVEAYEKEKRAQSAELVKINVLLKGKLTEKEVIELAVKSLNLSIKSLKRMREIVIEIKSFFMSFEDFMQMVMDDSVRQVELYDDALQRDHLTAGFISRIKRNIDEFFVTQSAEWLAAGNVSSKFVCNFNDGWNKLNKLSGTYLTGDDLKHYLDQASDKIELISNHRVQSSTEKLDVIKNYRDKMTSDPGINVMSE